MASTDYSSDAPGQFWVRCLLQNSPLAGSQDYLQVNSTHPGKILFLRSTATGGGVVSRTKSRSARKGTGSGCWLSVSMHQSCRNKTPQTRWLKTTDRHCLPVLEARHPEWRCWRAHTPSGGSRRECFLASSSFWGLPVITGVFGSWQHRSKLNLIITWPSSFHVNVCVQISHVF